MELCDLEERIITVMEKERKEQCYQMTFFNELLSDTEGTKCFRYPNAESLIELFELVQENQRHFFIRVLKESTIEEIEYPVVDEKTDYTGYVSVAVLGFYVLAKLGYYKEALDALDKRFERSSLIYLLVNDIIENDLFNNEALIRILNKLNSENKPPEPIEITLREKLLKKLAIF
jgi:hypothetical protein